jgi:hypothetical protein
VAFLSPRRKSMTDKYYIIFTAKNCPTCHKVKNKLLNQWAVVEEHEAEWHADPKNAREWRGRPELSYWLVAHMAMHNGELPAVYSVNEGKFIDNEEILCGSK